MVSVSTNQDENLKENIQEKSREPKTETTTIKASQDGRGNKVFRCPEYGLGLYYLAGKTKTSCGNIARNYQKPKPTLKA